MCKKIWDYSKSWFFLPQLTNPWLGRKWCCTFLLGGAKTKQEGVGAADQIHPFAKTKLTWALIPSSWYLISTGDCSLCTKAHHDEMITNSNSNSLLWWWCAQACWPLPTGGSAVPPRGRPPHPSPLPSLLPPTFHLPGSCSLTGDLVEQKNGI